MTSVYSYVFGSNNNNNNSHGDTTANGNGTKHRYYDSTTNNNNNNNTRHRPPPITSNPPSEQTSLLNNNNSPTKPTSPPSPHEFYFPPTNPSIQRYYRFTVTPLTPIAALHKRPITNNNNQNEGVTGLLRRSAVVPSHGTDATGNWILVSVGGRSGWARKKTSEQQAGFTLAPTFMAKEAWMGNHAFLCHGKIMLGSDAPSLFFTNGLLVVGLGLYFGVLLPKLKQELERNATREESFVFLNHPSWIFWVSIVITIVSLATLWIAAIMDPGILPAHSSPHKPSLPTGSPVGGPLGFRYCSTCNIFRPPRSKHCNSCNVCVDRMDHHCPWIGNCVAARNYRYFFLFLVSICALTIIVTLVAVQLLVLTYEQVEAAEVLPGVGPVVLPPLRLRGKHHDTSPEQEPPTLNDFAEYGQHESHILWKSITSMPVTVLFGIFTFLCSWSLISLLGYHSLIISVAQTTNERVRGVYRYASAVNTADKGCCRNWWHAFCSPRAPSLLPRDFSQVVVCNEVIPEREWTGEEIVVMAADKRNQSEADLPEV